MTYFIRSKTLNRSTQRIASAIGALPKLRPYQYHDHESRFTNFTISTQ